jgi:serine/threonine protein kinase
MTPSSEIQLEEPKTPAISTNERSGDEADVFFSINSSSETLLPRSHGAWRTCIIRKVFHRDLKPRNVLVSSNSNHITVKIADFGLSQQAQLHDLDTRGFTNRRMFTGIVGTTPYMSNQILYMPPNPLTNKPPESMCAESVNLSVSPKIIPGFYSANVDVYSFAVTCAEILAGQPPFMDIPRTPLAVLNGTRPYLPPDLDFRLRDLIQL